MLYTSDINKFKELDKMENNNLKAGEAGLALIEAEFVEQGLIGEQVAKTSVTKSSVVAYMPEVIIEPLSDNFVMPTYAKDGDSGMDVYSTTEALLTPDSTVIIPLDFKIQIPKHPMHHLGYRWELQARPRGGISANTPLRVSNAPGTIDNGFRGNVGIILTNTLSPSYKTVVDMDMEDFDIDALSKAEQQELASKFIALEELKSDYVITIDNNRSIFQIHDEEQGDVLSPQPEGTYFIRKGDKIAQLVFVEVIRPLKFMLGTVDMNTDRGEGAYSSTGLTAEDLEPSLEATE
jgi:dUTPase